MQANDNRASSVMGFQFPIPRPGFRPERLIALARECIAEMRLDLRGRTILTEAATGVYVVTPIIAALAGARRVFAVARDSRHGSTSEAVAWLHDIAERAGVADTISIIDAVPHAFLDQVDIVTNSGHIRPINDAIIDALPPHAVVALMFEAWEWRSGDIDYAACERRSLPVVGVNERHETIDVFSYLGPLAIRLLHDAGVPVYRSRIALVCDNEFNTSLLTGLVGQGAHVTQARSVRDLPPKPYEAVLLALRPADNHARLDDEDARRLAAMTPGVIVAQFWGDVDREAVAAAGLQIWPPNAPATGHMAILLSEIGPDAVVRLQAGGLKAAQVVLDDAEREEPGLAQIL